LLYGKSIVGFDLFLFYQQNKKGNTEKQTLILDTPDRIAFRKKNKQAVLTLLITRNEYAERTDTKAYLVNNGKHILENLKYKGTILEILKYNQVVNKNLDISNILYIIDRLDKAPITKSKMNDWEKFQMFITMFSHDPTNKRFNKLYAQYIKRNRKHGPKIDSILRNASFTTNETAINQLRDLASKNKVVMLNECHWCPSHRIMATKLLSLLKEKGYSYLAIEALNENEEYLINQKSYPLKYSGLYTKEPYFGLFIREAKRLGFEIVSYDYGFSTLDNREQRQAENIAETFKGDPEAKIFIYTGGDQIIESETSRKWMAQYFKELTGIDPITIDQLMVMTDTDKKILLSQSTTFKNIDGLDRSVDYFLINNIQPSLDEIFPPNDLKTKIISLEGIKKEQEEVFVTVFYLEEYENDGFKAVPILNRISKEDILEIALPKNQKYKVVIFNKDNQIIAYQIISSEA